MKKFIPALSLVTLLSMHAPVDAAWSARGKAEAEKKASENANTTGFNLKDRRSAFVEADYLLWKPQMEDCYVTTKITTPSIGGNSGGVTTVGKLKQPSFELSSGVRVGVGSFNTDSWDIGLRGTYLYSQAKNHLSADINKGTILIPDWAGTAFGFQGTEAEGRWQMNFGLIDFAMGREFFLTKRFVVHPFIGLRGAIINQTNHIDYTSNFTLTPPSGPQTTESATSKFSAKNDIWGVGPRLGLDLNFYVSNEWSFLGGLAGSLLYTHYQVKEKIHGWSATDTLSHSNYKFKDISNYGRCNIDAYFGLGWDHWYNNGKNRFAVAVAFEAQQWINLNQWFQLDRAVANDGNGNNSPAAIQENKHHGDLSLIGGTVHFQFDF